MSAVKDAIVQAVDGLGNELEALSRQIHDHPELGYQETQACAWLAGFLAAKGLTVETGVGGVETAFRATIEGGDGPTIAILCEYDALPGIGHACGHNVIATSGAGAGAGAGACFPHPLRIKPIITIASNGMKNSFFTAQSSSCIVVVLMRLPSVLLGLSVVGSHLLSVNAFKSYKLRIF